MSDDDLENTVRKLTELMKKKEQDLKREKEELDKREINLETSYPNLGKTDDVLNLNVGGTPMAVLRRTLTQAKGSMLATKFNGRWDDSQTKDSEGRFFIDQKFIYFEKLVDYLREVSCQTELTKFPKSPTFHDGRERRSFNTMVEYYGMTHFVFPIEICMCNKGATITEFVSDYPGLEITADEKKTYFLFPKEALHTRLVKTFEVTLSEHSTIAQIGWIQHSFINETVNVATGGHVGVGYTNKSMAYDSSRDGMVWNGGSFTECKGITVQKGTVVRCEDWGAIWKFDGKAKVAKTGVSMPDDEGEHTVVESIDTVGWIPCLTIKGTFQITHIELDFD